MDQLEEDDRRRPGGRMPLTGIPHEQSVRGGLRTIDGTDVSLSLREAKFYLAELSEALDATHHGVTPKGSCIAWPAGLSHSVGFGLETIARAQTRITHSCFIVEGHGSLTVEDLLRMPDFDHKRLNELLLAIEEFLKEQIGSGGANRLQVGIPNSATPRLKAESANLNEILNALSTPWEMVGRILAPVLAASAELNGTAKLSDVLSPELIRLASGMRVAVGSINVGWLSDGTLGPVAAASVRLARMLDQASETERMVVEHRLAGPPRKTLAEIGIEVGVTRERIRQIQKKLERKIQIGLGTDFRVVAAALKEEQGPVVPKGHLDNRINGLLSGKPALVSRLIRQALVTEMGYRLDSGHYLDDQATEVISSICALAERIADDVGIVDKEALIGGLPSKDWQAFWPAFQRCCQFHDLYGFLSTRDSAKARTKAALLSIGRAASKEEISEICGFADTQIGSYLSNIASVVRADKDRWGLREWIDDEYEGIAAEIIQRINEDGGATTVERLLTELPEKFGVSRGSVLAFMKTPKFVVRDGLVSLAHVSGLQLRDLDDVISGRDGDGAPCWTFVVEDRFFDGYSVTGVPPEFAKALGCKPDQRTSVRIANLPYCRDLSLNWRLATTTGANVGYLANPLRQLGLQPGQRVRIAIKGANLVTLTADEETVDGSSTSAADAIVERMIERRRVL